MCAPLKENETFFEYGIGVLVNDEAADADAFARSKGYRYWETAPCTYVVFNCIGEDGECIGDAWELFYKEFLPQSGYESCVESDYEVYFDEGKEWLILRAVDSDQKQASRPGCGKSPCVRQKLKIPGRPF